MTIKKYLHYTGKILYKAVEIPINILVGNYSERNQKIIKKNKELKKQLKSLDSKLAKTKLQIKTKSQILQESNTIEATEQYRLHLYKN